MTWPADPARAQIVAAVGDAALTGKPKQLEWDRIEPLGRQAWRRFSVLAVGGDLETLRKAPQVGPGGLVYLARDYLLTVFYERGKHRQSMGADSDALIDDAGGKGQPTDAGHHVDARDGSHIDVAISFCLILAFLLPLFDAAWPSVLFAVGGAHAAVS